MVNVILLNGDKLKGDVISCNPKGFIFKPVGEDYFYIDYSRVENIKEEK